jgi:hypothetical protein
MVPSVVILGPFPLRMSRALLDAASNDEEEP